MVALVAAPDRETDIATYGCSIDFRNAKLSEVVSHLPDADEIALGNGRFHGAGQDFLRPAQDGLFKARSFYISKLVPLELRLPGLDAPRGFASDQLCEGFVDTLFRR